MNTSDKRRNNQPDKDMLKRIRRIQSSERAELIFDLYEKKVPELVKDILEEMDAKNEAYNYILEHGLGEDFRVWCNERKSVEV
jgi:hypothetical protein